LNQRWGEKTYTTVHELVPEDKPDSAGSNVGGFVVFNGG
jgi:hypothetical protein